MRGAPCGVDARKRVRLYWNNVFGQIDGGVSAYFSLADNSCSTRLLLCRALSFLSVPVQGRQYQCQSMGSGIALCIVEQDQQDVE